MSDVPREARQTYRTNLRAGEGAPVVIVQPGLMLGPHNPKLGMGTRLVRDSLTGKTPVVPAAGLPLGDVRDVAAALSRAVEAGAGARRYMTGGTYSRFADLVDLIADIGGRPLPGRSLARRSHTQPEGLPTP